MSEAQDMLRSADLPKRLRAIADALINAHPHGIKTCDLVNATFPPRAMPARPASTASFHVSRLRKMIELHGWTVATPGKGNIHGVYRLERLP